MKATFIIVCLIISAAASHYGHALMHENTDAITVMITVITVFAGLLVAITTILGDPAMIPRGSWRKAEVRHKRLEAMLIRHSWLFYCYLSAIALLFAGVLVQKAPKEEVAPWVRDCIETAYLFLGVFSFLLTLALPRTLGRIQLARSEAEIEERRATESSRNE